MENFEHTQMLIGDLTLEQFVNALAVTFDAEPRQIYNAGDFLIIALEH